MTAIAAETTSPAEPRIRPKLSRDDLVMRIAMAAIALFLLVAIVLPLYAMLSKSVEDRDGNSQPCTNGY